MKLRELARKIVEQRKEIRELALPSKESLEDYARQVIEEVDTALSYSEEDALELLMARYKQEKEESKRFYLELAFACLEHFRGRPEGLYKLEKEVGEEGLALRYFRLLGGEGLKPYREYEEKCEEGEVVVVNPNPLYSLLLSFVVESDYFHEYYKLFVCRERLKEHEMVYAYVKDYGNDDEVYDALKLIAPKKSQKFEIFSELVSERPSILAPVRAYRFLNGLVPEPAYLPARVKALLKLKGFKEPIFIYPFYQYVKELSRRLPSGAVVEYLKTYLNRFEDDEILLNAYLTTVARLEGKPLPEPLSKTARKIAEDG